MDPAWLSPLSVTIILPSREAGRLHQLPQTSDPPENLGGTRHERLHHKGREAELSKPQSQVECRIKSIWSCLAVRQPRGMLCGRAMDWTFCSVSKNALKFQHTAQSLGDAAIHQQIIVGQRQQSQ